MQFVQFDDEARYRFYNDHDHTERSGWDNYIKLQWWTEDSFPESNDSRSNFLDSLKSTDWLTKVAVVITAAALALVNWN